MPKTAGTSIIAAMQEQFGERAYVYGQTEPYRDFEKSAPGMDGRRFIAGHLTMEQIDLIPGDKRIFTVVRPPVDRILSWYDFLCRASRATLYGWTREGDIHTFIERCCEVRRDVLAGKPVPPPLRANSIEMFNNMCRRLHPDATAESALRVIRERGIRTLDQSRLADDLPILSDWMDVPDLPRLNVTAERKDYPESARLRIAELNTEDANLYAALSTRRST